MQSEIESLLKSDRLIVGGGLALIVVLAWLYLLAGAGMGTNGIDMTRMFYADAMPMMTAPVWNAGYVTLMFFMWWIMMAAMMLPSAAPTILLAAALNRRAHSDTPPFGSTIAFTLGYLATWAAFSVAAVVAQWGLQKTDAVSVMLRAVQPMLAGGLLLAAGLWQVTEWKNACLRSCRSPVSFLVRRHRPGKLGALRTGAEHGALCVGCCWVLMLLLFVGGVMNLFWVLALTALVLIEKLLPAGQIFGKLLGAVLIVAGLARFILATG